MIFSRQNSLLNFWGRISFSQIHSRFYHNSVISFHRNEQGYSCSISADWMRRVGRSLSSAGTATSFLSNHVSAHASSISRVSNATKRGGSGPGCRKAIEAQNSLTAGRKTSWRVERERSKSRNSVLQQSTNGIGVVL